MNRLKNHSLEELYGIYKASFPHIFKELDEEEVKRVQDAIKAFEDYFGDKKKELTK